MGASCSVLSSAFLRFVNEKKNHPKRQREKFGGFSGMEIESVAIKPLSVVDETPTFSPLSGLTGFTAAALFLSLECQARC